VPVIGITGGIATGKSTFTRSLLRRLPAESFDADQAAHELLASDPDVRRAVEEAFGADIYNSEGRPNRARLRELVFSVELNRKRLEEILHPAIRARWSALAGQAVKSCRWLFVDLPLLYETGAEAHFDRVVVVACASATQRLRLQSERGLKPEMAAKIISAQLDLEIKISRADHLIWNDSTESSLEGHAEFLAAWLRQFYG
jgi:dephospho-CoA kinase